MTINTHARASNLYESCRSRPRARAPDVSFKIYISNLYSNVFMYMFMHVFMYTFECIYVFVYVFIFFMYYKPSISNLYFCIIILYF